MGVSKERDDKQFAGPVEHLEPVTMRSTLRVEGPMTTGEQRPIAGNPSAGGSLDPSTIAEVDIVSDVVRQIRHVQLQLTALPVSIAEADDFGGMKICDLPDSNLIIVGAEASLTLDKGGAATAATGVLTLTGNALDTETVVIDGKTYTFQTTLTDVDGNVLIGASASDSIDNLIAAITLGSGSGTLYAASTTLHPTVTAAAGSGDTMDATAKTPGVAGNSLATTETLTNGSWGAATLEGGTEGLLPSTDMTVGIGTAVASNATLSGDMINVLTAALTANEDPTDFELHTNELSTPALTFVDDGPAAALWLNVAAGVTEDASLTATGTLDVYYIDTGNITS